MPCGSGGRYRSESEYRLTAYCLQILLGMSKRQKLKRLAQKRIVRASKSGSFQ